MFKIGYAKWPIIFAVAIASAIGINRPAALASDQGTNPVTFQVNMAVQIFEQKFDPAADFVYVRGSFNGWAAVDTLVDVNGDSVYSKVIALDDSLVGKTINFKFYYKHGSTDVWEGDPNRSYEVPAGQSEVPLDFFDRDNVYNPPLGEEKTANITFRVDMSDYISRGIFTAGDTLVVRGNFNGWSGYDDRLTPQFGQPNLYTLTKALTTNVNAVLEYKFVMKLAGFPDVWESGGNRTFVFTGNDITLDSAVPKFADPRPTTQELTRTFVVNVRPLYRRLAAEGFILDIQSGDTIRTVKSIEIAGPDPPFNGWPWGNIPEQWRLWDDGSHGDETAGDSLFTNTFVFPAGSPREAEYKYGANTRDVEAGFAKNHILKLDDNVAQDEIFDVWGSPDTLYKAYTINEDFVVSVESRSKVIPKTFALSQNYPNPFNPETTINFDLPQKQHVVIIVYNMMGQEITRLVDEEKQAGSFKVTWNGRDSFGRQMPSGLYIYKIKAGKFTKTLKMLMLK